MRLSLAPVTVNELDPPDLIGVAAAAGFDAIGLRLLGAPGAAPVAPVIGQAAMVHAIERALAATGVTTFSATGLWLLPEWTVESALPALDLAARLGVEQFLAVGNDPEEGRMTDNLGRLAEAAAGFGLRVALELMPYMAVKTIGQARRLIDGAGQDNLGLVIDALHLARAGGTPADVAAIPRARIGYVQLCDAPLLPPPDLAPRVESLTSRLYPGEGGLPLRALMAALPEDITVDVETPVARHRHLPPRERAIRAAEATRRFLAEGRAAAQPI